VLQTYQFKLEWERDTALAIPKSTTISNDYVVHCDALAVAYSTEFLRVYCARSARRRVNFNYQPHLLETSCACCGRCQLNRWGNTCKVGGIDAESNSGNEALLSITSMNAPCAYNVFGDFLRVNMLRQWFVTGILTPDCIVLWAKLCTLSLYRHVLCIMVGQCIVWL